MNSTMVLTEGIWSRFSTKTTASCLFCNLRQELRPLPAVSGIGRNIQQFGRSSGWNHAPFSLQRLLVINVSTYVFPASCYNLGILYRLHSFADLTTTQICWPTTHLPPEAALCPTLLLLVATYVTNGETNMERAAERHQNWIDTHGN